MTELTFNTGWIFFIVTFIVAVYTCYRLIKAEKMSKYKGMYENEVKTNTFLKEELNLHRLRGIELKEQVLSLKDEVSILTTEVAKLKEENYDLVTISETLRQKQENIPDSCLGNGEICNKSVEVVQSITETKIEPQMEVTPSKKQLKKLRHSK